MHSLATRLTLLGTALVLALAGCSAPLSSDDRTALDTLAQVAGPTSGVDVDLIDNTECWLPSDHLVDDPAVNDTTWRVLCRVHWHEVDGEKRYQDTTCIGDFAADPMIDHCYRWSYYDLMPAYEDADGVPAG